MIIQIDDAGTGDIVGPGVIGFYHEEKREFLFKEIALEHFCEPLWSQKSPLQETVRLVQEGLTEWQVTPEDVIKLCRGNIFDEVRKWLTEQGYTYEDSIIEGPLQEAVEQNWVESVRALGIDDPKLNIQSGKDRFFVLFRWVARNPGEREKYVKSGFPAWVKKWREKAYERKKPRDRQMPRKPNDGRYQQRPPQSQNQRPRRNPFS
ncbi:MAG TPA: hypothetical protein VKK79_15550 [Candidatus Lokiarchaeia archaeon]|nr:hypothetical protein [Candidatus Lokiarchaeia archaeon]